MSTWGEALKRAMVTPPAKVLVAVLEVSVGLSGAPIAGASRYSASRCAAFDASAPLSAKRVQPVGEVKITAPAAVMVCLQAVIARSPVPVMLPAVAGVKVVPL